MDHRDFSLFQMHKVRAEVTHSSGETDTRREEQSWHLGTGEEVLASELLKGGLVREVLRGGQSPDSPASW